MKKGTTLICQRNFEVKDSFTVFNTPKGISNESFIENYKTFATWRETDERMSFSKGDKIEVIMDALLGYYGGYIIKVVQSQYPLFYTKSYLYEHHGFKATKEEVFFMIPSEYIGWFLEENNMPKKIAYEPKNITNERNYVTAYPLHYIQMVNENLFEFQATQLYGESSDYNYEKIANEMHEVVQAYCDVYFEEKMVVETCVFYGFRMNPDRIAVRIFFFIAPLDKLQEAKKSLSMKEDEFPSFVNYYNVFWDHEQYIKNLMKHFSKTKSKLNDYVV